MIKYSIMMGVRVLCIVALPFTQGWWLLAVAIGAIVLPYFAVVVANVPLLRKQRLVLRPGGMARRGQATVPPPASAETSDDEAKFS